MKAFGNLLVSDLKQFFRQRSAVFFAFGFPLLFMIIFGFAFSGSENVSYDIGLVDQDASTISGQISQAIRRIPIFKITEGSLNDELAKLKKGDIQAVVLIPSGTQSNISARKTTNITVYYDPSQISSSPIIISVLSQATDQINLQFASEPMLIELTPEAVQAHNLRYIDFLVPGVLAMSILFLGLFGSLNIVDRRERKILKRFSATPVGRSTMLYSQIVYRMILVVLQALIIIIVAHLVFGVSVVGNWLLLLGLLLLGILTFISIGYLALSRAATQEGALPIIQLIQFPMLFLSGIFFPIDIMPSFMRPIVNIMPLTYLGDALRQVMVGATPLFPLHVDAAVLGSWLIVSLLLTVRFFRWE